MNSTRRDLFRFTAAPGLSRPAATAQTAPAFQVAKISNNLSVVAGNGGNIGVVTAMISSSSSMPASNDLHTGNLFLNGFYPAVCVFHQMLDRGHGRRGR